MKTVTGDLIRLAETGHFDVIIHGCNCFCAMGAGIALQIRNRFPEAFEADARTPSGDRSKLGTYTHARIERNGHTFTIVNGYTQYDFAGSEILVDYHAIALLFSRIRSDFHGLRIGYPKIGAGLAGGDWDRISAIINRELQGEDHTLVEFAR